MKSWKLAMLGLAAVFVAGMYSARAFAQAGAPASPMAEPTTAQAPYGAKKGEWHKYRKSDVQTTMTKVGQEVWHAQFAGASAQHMQELFLDGQHSFLAAERISKKYPNDVTGGRD
jgi:hypothetical protein